MSKTARQNGPRVWYISADYTHVMSKQSSWNCGTSVIREKNRLSNYCEHVLTCMRQWSLDWLLKRRLLTCDCLLFSLQFLTILPTSLLYYVVFCTYVMQDVYIINACFNKDCECYTIHKMISKLIVLCNIRCSLYDNILWRLLLLLYIRK